MKLTDIDVKGKKVFVRAAFDVPLDSTKGILDPKRVKDDSRIKDIIPTLSYLIKNNAKIILEGGWLGRPKGEDYDLSMAPIVLRLQEILKEEGMLKHNVLLTPNCLDGSKPRSVFRNKDEVEKDIGKLKEGQIMLLENVRFDSEANSDNQEFSRFIASLCGKNAVYVNEAEAQNHRPEATIVSVPKYVVENGGKAVFGIKYEEVIKYMGSISKKLDTKERGPFVFFLSGKKIETQVGITSKITVTHSLLDKMKEDDVLIVQGAVIYTFLLAKKYLNQIEKNVEGIKKIIKDYNDKITKETTKIKDSEASLQKQTSLQKEKSDKIKDLIKISDEDIKNLIGSSFVEWKEIGEQIFFAAEVCLKAMDKKVILVLNEDHIITDKYPDKYGNLPNDAQIKMFNSATSIPNGWLGVAPGSKTLDEICKKVKNSYMVILAGPVGIEDSRLEDLYNTNKKLLKALKEAKNKGTVTIGAGGDTSSMIRTFKGEDAFTVISNAGGATLELIEKGEKLPGIEALSKLSWKSKK